MRLARIAMRWVILTTRDLKPGGAEAPAFDTEGTSIKG